uniref:uncharacterized protein LOC104265655 isoform X1 n=1 Tax=Ciona intestinalis TaxID=7719 RepID=UPI000EF4B5B5|nr:uncharacterized protein LOC104265655 isoform X1 [Ciona intestinalis]|eukprot:XP_026690004.1 uncharacterized protein LOC104265655 isoform X1 [Ciona intestinalis]
MNGHNLDGLPVSVDCFKETADERLHFLTHMHSDHTVGLSSRWCHTVYCTEVTATLMKLKFGISDTYIQIMDDNHTYCLSCGHTNICVRMIPTNHCPGACMFLFETDSTRILYTGDFRFNEMVEMEVQKCLNPIRPIDLLYLDNTYCEPSCNFPSQQEAVLNIISICRHHIDERIVFGVSYIGHENLLCLVAKALQEYVYVEEAMLERLLLINPEYGKVFRVGMSARLNAVPNSVLNGSQWSAVPTVLIKPTARLGSMRISGNLSTVGVITYTIPYSNHSNYQELEKFVKLVKPLKIKPIVLGRTSYPGMESYFRADMTKFNRFLSKPKSLPKINVLFERKRDLNIMGATSNVVTVTTSVNDLVPRKKLTGMKRKINVILVPAKKPRGAIYTDEDSPKEKMEIVPQNCPADVELEEKDDVINSDDKGSKKPKFVSEIVEKIIDDQSRMKEPIEVKQEVDNFHETDTTGKVSDNFDASTCQRNLTCKVEDMKFTNIETITDSVNKVEELTERTCVKITNKKLSSNNDISHENVKELDISVLSEADEAFEGIEMLNSSQECMETLYYDAKHRGCNVTSESLDLIIKGREEESVLMDPPDLEDTDGKLGRSLDNFFDDHDYLHEADHGIEKDKIKVVNMFDYLKESYCEVFDKENESVDEEDVDVEVVDLSDHSVRGENHMSPFQGGGSSDDQELEVGDVVEHSYNVGNYNDKEFWEEDKKLEEKLLERNEEDASPIRVDCVSPEVGGGGHMEKEEELGDGERDKCEKSANEVNTENCNHMHKCEKGSHKKLHTPNKKKRNSQAKQLLKDSSAVIPHTQKNYDSLPAAKYKKRRKKLLSRSAQIENEILLNFEKLFPF